MTHKDSLELSRVARDFRFFRISQDAFAIHQRLDSCIRNLLRLFKILLIPARPGKLEESSDDDALIVSVIDGLRPFALLIEPIFDQLMTID